MPPKQPSARKAAGGPPPAPAVAKAKTKGKGKGQKSAPKEVDPVKNAKILFTKYSLVMSQAESVLSQVSTESSWEWARKAEMDAELKRFVTELRDSKNHNGNLPEVFSVGLKNYEKGADQLQFHQAVADINAMEGQISQLEAEMAFLLSQKDLNDQRTAASAA